MARTLEILQKQYNSSANTKRGMGMMGGPRRGMMHGAKGKPKNAKATIARLMKYVGKYKAGLVAVVFCMLFGTISSLLGSYLLAPIIDRITLAVKPDAEISMSALEKAADGIIEYITGNGIFGRMVESGKLAEITAYILVALGVLLFVYLVNVTATYLQQRLMMTISQNSVEAIRFDLFKKLQTLPIRYFDSHSTGEIMSRFTNDVDNIDAMLNNSLVAIVSGMITLLGTLVFMLTTSWILTAVTVLFIPVFARGGAAIAKSSSKYYGGQQAALGAVNGYIEETVSGQKVVKVFNHEDDCVDEFSLLNGDLREKQFKAQFFGGIMGPVMGNTSQISYAVTVGLGGVLMCTSGFTPGALTVFAGYSRHFSQPINTISMQMSTIFAALAGAERVFDVMDTPSEKADLPTAQDTPMKGEVVLDHVFFGYNPDQVILNDISLTAYAGQKIAFVGSTGAGKTTVTNLLNRFYDIDDGKILIDGKPLIEYHKKFLRSQIAMVLQDTHLFTGTVRENIRYGRLDATDEEVVEAAKIASAHSFIMRLSDGYDTVIAGDGANLSQGQRQLLNIARAAISKAPILVLDEATSSVDTRTERHIEHGMDRIMKSRTTFVIAHRLSTVRNADMILVLEHGVVIERGNHEELLNQKGRYYQLYTGVTELD